MSATAPWSVKGIEPRAREIAKDLARRSGMTLGEWLNTMILDDEEDGVVPLSNRRHAADAVDRRNRNRRVDDVYGATGADYDRLSDAIEAIAGRLEASERRSTIAVQGVDQAVAALLRRLDEQSSVSEAGQRRVEELAEDLKDTHRRLRRFELESGPQAVESVSKMETSITALSSRLYEMDERQRASAHELRQRLEAVEAVDPSRHTGPGADYLAQAAARLDAAQSTTGEALRRLERSFADLDTRLRQAESRPLVSPQTDAHRFEKLAEGLTRSVEANRAEMIRRLETTESDNRMSRLEQALLAIGEKVKSAEDRSSRDVEAMGREVVRIAQNLDTRIGTMERDGRSQFERLLDQVNQKVVRDFAEADKKIEHNMVRLGQALEQRQNSADDRHALALEKLGSDITRISERLNDRIAQSEHKNAQVLDDISDKLTEATERFEQRYDRTAGELAERMRQSEERTARLLAEARETFKGSEKPVAAPRASTTADLVEPIFAAAPTPAWAEDFIQEPLGAFPSEPPSATGAFATDPSALGMGETMASAAMAAPSTAQDPFSPHYSGIEDAFASGPSERPAAPLAEGSVVAAAMPGSQGPFGGADISDVLAATDPVRTRINNNDPNIPFEAETEFVDPAALRAAAAAGRASSTRQTLDAARAAMATPETADSGKSKRGFGLKRGGKSRLQERMDDQATREGGTIRKAVGASAVAMALTAAAAVGYSELTGEGFTLPGLGRAETESSDPIAAVAVTPSPETIAEGAQLYAQATEELDAGKTEGLQTMIRSAEIGNVQAQTHLANLYKNGESGVTVDLVKSRAWAFRAAQTGDARAEHFYGMMLYAGEGGAQNQAEALVWLKRAADQGLVDSQYNVARLYESGAEGIPSDLTQAFAWYTIAGRAGDAEARTAAERVEGRLTAGQRTAARTQVEAFQTEPLA